jgi:hypothetical protein
MEVADKDWFDLCDRERELQAELDEYKIREETYIEMAGEQSAEIARLKSKLDSVYGEHFMEEKDNEV